MVAKLKKEYDVELEWKPFYLRPDTPPEGMELPDYVKRAQESGANVRLMEMAAANDLAFVSVNRLYNTRLAHEATAYALENGKGIEFHRIIFDKVYGQGQDISKWEILVQAAQEAGLNASEMQTLVESGKYTQAVSDEVRLASQIGVTGVPTYVINDRYAIVGAQPIEAFKNALGKMLKS